MRRLVRRRLGLLFEHERLLMISVSTVLVMAGQGVVAPVLPLFARDFGVGAATIGLTLSFFALSRLILNVPLGILADRRGRRMLLVGGPLVTSVGMVGSGFSQNIEQLLAWRFVAGAGSGMYMTGAMAYLTDISTRENRARFIGANQGALLLGVSIGPALGGVLAELFGLRAPFHVVGAAALLAAAYAFWRLPETLTRTAAAPAGAAPAPSRTEAWAPIMGMVRSRGFLAVSLVTTSIFLTRTAGRQTLVPLLSVERLDMFPGMLGIIFTGMSVISMLLILPSSVFADRFGRKAVIVPSGLATAVGLLLFAGADTHLLFVTAAVVLAAGMAMAGPAPAAYVADIAPEQSRGLAMALFRSAGDVGFVAGPPLLGLLADHSSFALALGVNAALVSGAALLFATLAPETVRRAVVPRPGEVRPAPDRR